MTEKTGGVEEVTAVSEPTFMKKLGTCPWCGGDLHPASSPGMAVFDKLRCKKCGRRYKVDVFYRLTEIKEK